MKKLLCLLLAVLMLIPLGATAFAGTVANDAGVYRVIVTDGQGRPVSDVVLQFCSETACTTGRTDAEGVAVFEAEPGAYTVHVLKAPEAFLPDDNEYQMPESFCDLSIVLHREDEASEGQFYDLSDCGVEFTLPDFMRDLRGQAVFSDHGELVYGSGVYFFFPVYLGRSGEELADYTALAERAETEALTEEETAVIRDFYTGTVWAELFIVAAIDGGRGLDEIMAYFALPEEYFSVRQELGTAGDCRFFLLMFDPDKFIELAVPDSTPEEYLEEYRSLLSRDPEDYVRCIRIKEPVSGFSAAQPGDAVVFDAETLDGTAVSSAEIFDGSKVTMINIWATWCGPCRGELADLEALSREFEAQGCRIIGVCLDAEDDESAEAAARLLADYGVSYANYRFFAAVDELLPAQAIPTSYFVDSEGRILLPPVVGANPAAYTARLAEALALLG